MRIRLPKIPLLLIVSLWLPVVAHAVVGRLVEGDLRLDKGETWEWPGSEAPVAGMELRGKLLDGERDRIGGWDMALRGLLGDTIAVITVEWDARTSVGDYVDGPIAVVSVTAGRGMQPAMDMGRVMSVQGNVVSVSILSDYDGRMEIWSGGNKLGLLATLPQKAGLTGLSVCALGAMEIVSVNVSGPATPVADITVWDEESLARHFASSADFREGFYDYLDSDIDMERCRLGGRYRLGVVGDGRGGYDLIYVAGAEENSRNWVEGMAKGKLSGTIFQNHYDLLWRDSGFAEDMDEAWAELDGTVMSLHFPREKATVRFSRSRHSR